MPHPDEGLIHAWLDGELDAAEAVRVEALVARDVAWAAAAAEARGLIAASARIVGALDHLNTNVLPKAPATRRAPRWWMARLAALIVIVAGTTIVLRRSDVQRPLRDAELQSRTASPPPVGTLNAPPPSAPVSGAPARETAAPGTVAAKTPPAASPPAAPKPAPLEAKGAVAAEPKPGASMPERAVARVDSVSAATRARAPSAEPQRTAQAQAAGGAAGAAAGASGERQKVASEVVPLPAAPKAQAADRADARLNLNAVAGALRKTAIAHCFDLRGDAIRAGRTWRVDSAQVADSVKVLKLVAHGDTLRNAATGVVAIKVPCPEP